MKNTEENYKQFDLGAILNITTGRMFTRMSDVYAVLNYLTGESIDTYQLPKLANIAKYYVLSLHPELEGVGVDIDIDSSISANKFLEEQKKIYGATLSLKPLPTNYDYQQDDSFAEKHTIKRK